MRFEPNRSREWYNRYLGVVESELALERGRRLPVPEIDSFPVLGEKGEGRVGGEGGGSDPYLNTAHPLLVALPGELEPLQRFSNQY